MALPMPGAECNPSDWGMLMRAKRKPDRIQPRGAGDRAGNGRPARRQHDRGNLAGQSKNNKKKPGNAGLKLGSWDGT